MEKKTILIVEDSKAFAAALQDAFEKKYKYTILKAHTYTEFLQVLEQHKDEIIVAIADLTLPDAKDGEAAKILIKNGIPCIAFTGNYSSQLRKEMLSWGVADYVLKKGQQDIDYVVNIAHRLNENRKLNVLIVDDAPSSRAYLCELLQRQCFNVDSVSTAKEALNLIKQGYQARIVLIDLIMEEMDGLELLTHLRQSFDNTQMAIIGVSGLASTDQIAKFIKYGGNDFLIKPFEHEQVICRINSVALLQEQFTHLNTLNEQKNQMLGMAAHDIRGPLGVVMSCGSMLKRELKTENATMLLDLLSEAANNMEELLNSILDISEIEHATIKINKERINLSSALLDVVNEMRILANNKQQVLEFSPARQDAFVFADKARIQDVFRNLISNAIKYSPLNSAIEIEIKFNQKRALIRFIDQGPGVSAKEQHLLFQPFAKISSKTTGGERSTGLGLAICKKVIDLHQGTISYMKNPNQGSTFEIILPIHNSD